MNENNIYLKYICKCRDLVFNNSPFNEKVFINENSDKSISLIFCGQKPFGFKNMQNNYSFIIKNDYFALLDMNTVEVSYEISNLKSLPDFTRILIPKKFDDFEIFVDYIFSFSEKYVDEHYIPEYTYDCCSRYMECSDALHCVNPNPLHARSCTYRKKLHNGIIFFGKNRTK